MISGINVSPATTENAAIHDTEAIIVKDYLRLKRIRVNVAFSVYADQYPDFIVEGFEAVLDAYAGQDFGIHFNFGHPPNDNTWKALNGGNDWELTRRPPEPLWDEMTISYNHMLNKIHNICCGIYSIDPSRITVSWFEECCIGGVYGPLDDEGTLGTGVRDLLQPFEGTWDNDAFWDDFVVETGEPGFANVRGICEILTHIYTNVTIPSGFIVSAPSLEMQYPLVEVPSAFTNAANIFAMVDEVSCQAYLGSQSSNVNLTPTVYANLFRDMLITNYTLIRAETSLPINITEMGIAFSWIIKTNSISTGRKWGNAWSAFWNCANGIGYNNIYFYALRGYTVANDAEDSANFYLIKSTGNPNIGMRELIVRRGWRDDNSQNVPWDITKSWQFSASEKGEVVVEESPPPIVP